MKKIVKAYPIGSYRDKRLNENCRKEDEKRG